MRNRCLQATFILSTVALSWLAMMVLHEAGHVLHAWTSGGTVEHVELHPLAISRTDVDPNPHPLWVVWGGPVWGCLLPLVLLAVVWLTAKPYYYLAAFFAGFCLIANGAYLFAGAFFPPSADDGGVILQHDGARWQLIAFGLVTIPAGLRLWYGLGPHFGVGDSPSRIHPPTVIAVSIALVLLAAAMLFASGIC